ncbi:MAG: tRNA (adenosine(37)-N6)-threonylcarbamoyltransferase complex dimerization subunit type 1 TsaB [Anaerolineales bacterium]|nr:tRNA (adenosine(37)-N6)-threonylcarbamoyltransferase complex dimerization subunit type 1 TsaB [Anaerolineales bacterium]
MLLAIDTSTAQVGLALYDGNQVLGEMLWATRQHHTTELAPALAGLLARSSVSMDMVHALAVALGPGSFTSLRVGLAFVKGLALARRIPILGIHTLDVIAAAQPVGKFPLIAVIQAGRTRLAYRAYQAQKKSWQAEGELRSGTLDELLPQITTSTLLAGEFTAEERLKLAKKKNIKLAAPSLCARRPAVLAELAWARWQKNEIDEAASLAPIYLHVAGAPPA